MFYFILLLFSFSTSEFITFEENNITSTTLYILSDFNYEICPRNKNTETYCNVTLGGVCQGGIRELSLYIKNQRITSKNSFFIGTGSFFDQERFSILHYSTLVKALNFLYLDVINLDAEVFHYGIDMATHYFINNITIKDTIISVNLPQVQQKYIKKKIVNTYCSLYFIGFESKSRADKLNIAGLAVNQEFDSIKKVIKEIGNHEKKPIFFLFGPADLETAKYYLEQIPEVSVIILNRISTNETMNELLLYTTNTSWILGVDHRLIKNALGLANFDFDIHECKLMNYSGKIVEIPRNDTNIEDLYSLESETANILLKEYNQPGKVLSKMRTDFSNTETVALESTIADAIYYYVNSELEGDWPEPIAGAIVNSQVISNNKKSISKGILTIDTMMSLINDDFICKFWTDVEKLIQMFKLKDFYFSVSSSMKIRINNSSSDNSLVNFDLLWKDNTYHQLYFWKKDLFPWFAPCSLFEISSLGEIFNYNYTIYEITLMDVLRKYIYKPSENDLFIPSFDNSRIQMLTKEPSSIVIPLVVSIVVTALLIIVTWVFWKYCLKKSTCRFWNSTAEERIRIAP